MSTRTKLYIVTFRFNHHYSVSGYNRLQEFLPCTAVVIPSRVGAILQRTAGPRRRKRLLDLTGLTGYFPECRWLEWSAGLLAKLPGPSLFHFVYPENSYSFMAGYKHSRQTKVVATYHQPVHESRQFILKTEAIKKLDGLILMSDSQREFYEPLVGAERIFVVPHGVDLSFFGPPVQLPEEKPAIIAVGNWLRDFPTLVAALGVLEYRLPHLTCNIVSLEQNRSLFAGLKNVRFYAGITDAHLLSLYHQSSLAVLSLTGTAANNALLEALACGLPVVATDLPAIREYTTPEGCCYTRPGDAVDLAANLISVLEDQRARIAMGAANRAHAMRYAWETTAKQTMEVYDTVMGRSM